MVSLARIGGNVLEKDQSDAWLRIAKTALRSPLSVAQKQALESARVLVRLSRIVPLADVDNADTVAETMALGGAEDIR